MQQQTELITLKQKPIIEFSMMEERGREVALNIKSLNIDTLEPTPENRSRIKKTRSELNKELGVFEEQRKMIHGLITKPYKEFTSSYETNIKSLYAEAIETLKEKVNDIEEKMLAKKTDELDAYFKENNSFKFIKIDNIGLNIILSSTDKKLKVEIDTFLDTIKKDVESIEKQPDCVRIMSLYERSLDLSGSISKALSDIETENRIEIERVDRIKRDKELAIEVESERIALEEKKAEERASRKQLEADELNRRRIQAEKNAVLAKNEESENEAKRIAKEQEIAEQSAISASLENERLKKEKQDRIAQEEAAKKIHTMSFTVSGNISQLKEIKMFLENLGVSYE